jgi:hypothetical protein
VRQRLLCIAGTLAVLALVTWPATWPKGRDSFPLSPYPMFARKKSSPTLTLEYALAVDDSGAPSYVEPKYIGSGEVLQAMALIHGAIARGNAESASLCTRILARLRSEGRSVAELRFVRGTHDAVAYLQGDHSQSQERILVRCQK